MGRQDPGLAGVTLEMGICRICGSRGEQTQVAFYALDEIVIGCCRDAERVARSTEAPDITLAHFVYAMCAHPQASVTLRHHGLDPDALRYDIVPPSEPPEHTIPSPEVRRAGRRLGPPLESIDCAFRSAGSIRQMAPNDQTHRLCRNLFRHRAVCFHQTRT